MAKRTRLNGCVLTSLEDDDALPTGSNFDPLPDKSINYIQELLEQDDQGSVSPKLSDLIAFHTKAFELAALLKEDSPDLSLNWDSLTDVRQATAGNALAPQEDARELASLSKSSIELQRSRLLLLSSLRSSQNRNSTPSKVLNVGLLRPMLGVSSVPHERAKDEGCYALKHVDEAYKQRKTAISKLHQDSSFCTSTAHTLLDMAVKKPKFHDDYASIRSMKGGIPLYVDFHDMLLQCAYKIGLNDTQSAKAIAQKIKQQSLPHGRAADRVAYHFVKALYARFAGTGWSLYLGQLQMPRPSPRQILTASLKYVSCCPFTKASHLFANETILRVAKEASTLHIIEHQLTGLQYPSLFKQLAALPGGPPKVILVGLVVPHYSMLPAQSEVIYEALEEIGNRLSKCASSFKISFQFTPWVGMRENMRVQDFVSSKRPPNERFIFISTCFLRFVMDDVLDPRPIRLRSFKNLSDVCPDVFIQGVVTGAYSSPFYPVRFKEALSHFSCLYDVLDTFIERDNEVWWVFESEVLGKAILNVVACEGLQVSGRVEKYKEWQAVAEGTGMQQVKLNKTTKSKVEAFLKSRHKDYIVTDDRQYLLLGWKGRILYALSTWRSPAASVCIQE